jgi:5-methylcytosine-specific restriction endonuclease McrA
MRRASAKRPHVKLPGDEYHMLRLQLLRRDGWSCQSCGGMSNLEVHRIESRSHQGDDAEYNLITLCTECHSKENR